MSTLSQEGRTPYQGCQFSGNSLNSGPGELFSYHSLGHVKKYTCLASSPASFLGAASYLFIFLFEIFFWNFFFLKKKTWKTLLKWIYFLFQKKKCRPPSWKIARMSGKMYRAAILKKRKKKGLLLPIFRKNRTLNMFFLLFGLRCFVLQTSSF